MRSIEFLSEANVDEMAVPIDWDPKHFQHGKSFKARLQYALERAKKIGRSEEHTSELQSH